MKDRITHIMRAKNLKASDFASLLGIQPSAVSHILAGRNKPSLEIVRKIKETFPEYNLDWIIFGTGPMTTSEPFKEGFKEVLPESAKVLSHPSQNTSLASQDAAVQPSLFEVETNQEEDIDELEKPNDVFPKVDSKVSYPFSSGIRSIVIFYEDGTFESFLPR